MTGRLVKVFDLKVERHTVDIHAADSATRIVVVVSDGRSAEVVCEVAPSDGSGAVRWHDEVVSVDLARLSDAVRFLTVAVLQPGADLTFGDVLTISGVPAGTGCRTGLFMAAEFDRRDGDQWWLRGIGYGLSSAEEFADRTGSTDTRVQAWLGGLLSPPVGRRPVVPPLAVASTVAVAVLPGRRELGIGEQAAVARTDRPVSLSLIWERTSKDLDLYLLYIEAGGRPGACYYRSQGSLHRPPYVCLTSGDRRGRETIEIARPDALRFGLVCAYSALENGVGSFKNFFAHAQVDNNAGQHIAVPLHHRNRFSYWVAIALIDFRNPVEVAVRHVETYSRSGSEARPVLRADGKFAMDRGPIEFKRS